MNRIFLLILVSIFTVSTASAQTTFLKKLKKGEKADCCVLRCQCSHQYLQPGLGGPASYQTRTQNSPKR